MVDTVRSDLVISTQVIGLPLVFRLAEWRMQINGAVRETPWPRAMMAGKTGLEETARDSSGHDGGCVRKEMVEELDI